MSCVVVIGITGGIGSGKSVVSRVLRLNGFPVYDCDTEAKRIMACDQDVKTALKEIVGEDVYDASGMLDKVKMADCIFKDEIKREGVNRVVHRAVKKDFLEFAAVCDKCVVFCESAILASGGFGNVCNSIWVVEAPVEIKIGRVERRNGLSREDVMTRMESQRDEFDNLPADKCVMIENDDSSLLIPQIYGILENYGLTKDMTICLEKF